MKKCKILIGLILILFTGVCLSGCISLEQVQVTYRLNGGYNHELNKQGLLLNEELTLYEPYKQGEVFEGWYDNDEFLGEPITSISSDTVTEIILYAKWVQEEIIIEKFNISFNAQDGIIIEEETEYSEYSVEIDGGGVLKNLPNAYKENYEFLGWYSDNEGEYKFNINTPIYDDVTLYAKWQKIIYTISFNNSDIEEIKVESGEFIQDIPNPKKQFHKFLGWYLDEEFNLPFDCEQKINSDIDLYAKWQFYMSSMVQSQFPAIVIDTNNVEIVSKDDYIDAKVSVLNTLDEYSFIAEEINAEVRGRGNNTWTLEKKPYRIKFNKAISMFGSEYKAKSWTLLANHNDKSMLRNHLAYNFANSLQNLEFSPTAIFVDVYLNDKYMGVFTFSDQMEAGEGRVDIDTTIYENPADCDYLVELDNYAHLEPGAVLGMDYVAVNGKNFTIKSPKTDNKNWTKAHADYIQAYLQNFYDALERSDFEEIEQIIDIGSFIDHTIVHQVFKTWENDSQSAYLHVKNNKLYAGPIWDFDWSSGSDSASGNHEGFRDVQNDPLGSFSEALLKNQTFYQLFVNRYNEVMEKEIQGIFLNLLETTINYGYSLLNNYEVWDFSDFSHLLDASPKEYIDANTYVKQVEYLKNWLILRTEWLYEYYNSSDTWTYN